MKIKKENIILLLLLFIFFIPEGLITIGAENIITNALWLNNTLFKNCIANLYKLRNLIGISILIYFVLNIIKNKKINLKILTKNYGISIFYAFYFLIVTLSQSINNSNIYDSIILGSVNMGYILLIETYLNKNKNALLLQIRKVLLILFSLNIIIDCIYPMGITMGNDYIKTKYFLLGTKNQFSPMLILFATISFLCSNFIYKENKKFIIYDIMILLINSFIIKSSTAIVSVLILIFGYLIYQLKIIRFYKLKIFNNTKIIYLAIFVSLSFLFFNTQNIFKWIIVDILGKDLTFSARKYTWELAINQILDKPILGYGLGHIVVGHYYSHNLFLEILITSGIVGLTMHIIQTVSMINGINKIKDEKISSLAIISFISLIIINTTESFLFNIYNITLCILLNKMYQMFNESIEKEELSKEGGIK